MNTIYNAQFTMRNEKTKAKTKDRLLLFHHELCIVFLA